MKTLLLVLSMVATLSQPVAILNSYSGLGDYDNPNFFDVGYDLKYIVDHFVEGVDKGLEIIDNFASASVNVDTSTTVEVTPSVKYYNKANTYNQNNTSYYDYKSYTTNYDNRSYSTTYNYDNRTYTYNPIYNDFRTYDYTTYNNYNFFEDNDYYYITNNNITNYEYYIVNKIDVNDNRYYSYYYELPSGSKSYNLTKEEVLGEFMSYDIYQYEQVSDSPNTLALFKLNGNYQNEVANSDIHLDYNGNSFVNGKFDGALKLDGTIDMQLVGTLPEQYTVEFWFYNAINNGTYSGSGTPFTWHHSAYTYDNGTVRVWFNGVESTRATHKSAIITGINRTTSGTGWWNPIYTSRVNYSSPYGNKLPSVTVGNSTISTVPERDNYGVREYGHYYQVSYSGGSFAPSNTLDPNDPLHYYPLFSQSGIDFGFTGVGDDEDLDCYVVNVHDSVSRDYYSNTDNYATFTNASITSLTHSTTTTDYVDMSQCMMDEIRITRGILYTDSTFTYPQDEFTYGHIWTRPDGDDFNVGDIAVMSPVEITDYRIGGSDYSFPSVGNVYIGLISNVGSYAKVYNGQNWIPCDFGVWNGSEWADGVGFNFKTLTWGVKDNNINIDINIDQDINVTENDKQSFRDLISIIGEWLAIVPLCISFCVFIPTPVKMVLGGVLGLLAILLVVKLIKR